MRRLLVLLALAALAGCEAPPIGAYGFPDRPPPRPTDRGPQVEPPGGALRPLAIGQLDDLTIQPIGAHYAPPGVVDRLAPGAGVEQTYFYWAGAPTLRHALRAALVDLGVRAFLDDADLGVATPYGGTAYPRGVLVLRGELRALDYARIEGRDLLASRVSWTLVDGDTGRVVAQAQHDAVVEAGAASGPEAGEDPFSALGERLAAKLLGDPLLRGALASSPRPAGAVEAGAPRREEERR